MKCVSALLQAKVEHGALLGIESALRYDVWHKIKRGIESDQAIAVADLLSDMFEPTVATRITKSRLVPPLYYVVSGTRRP